MDNLRRQFLIEMLQQCTEQIVLLVHDRQLADFLAVFLSESGHPATSIHGARWQSQRAEAI